MAVQNTTEGCDWTVMKFSMIYSTGLNSNYNIKMHFLQKKIKTNKNLTLNSCLRETYIYSNSNNHQEFWTSEALIILLTFQPREVSSFNLC